MNNDGCETPIRVPSAPFRPGESASFEEWSYSPSDLMKPDPLSCEAKDTIPHSTGLIRVLGDDGSRSGEWILISQTPTSLLAWSTWLDYGSSMTE